MDFTFTEEQTMLFDMTTRYLGNEYGFEKRAAIVASEAGMSDEVWRGIADLGLLALLVPEENGGSAAGPVETMLVMSAFGKGLLVEPYLASAVLATSAIARLGDARQRAAWLEPMAAGDLIAVVAHDEPAGTATRATKIGGGTLLEGRKTMVAHAGRAGLLLVSARCEDGALGLFAVDPAQPGVSLVTYPTVDGARAGDVILNQVHVADANRLGDGDISADLDAVFDIGLAALCGEALGVLQRSLDATIEYTRTRKQFGSPIGKFQALRHRMADMLIHVEQTRSMACLAAVRADEADAAVRARALSAAKVIVGEACRFVGQQAVQLHGGMGVTDELDVSHCFKRLFAIEKTFGSTREHLSRFSRALVA
ncbi:acyl-CoA dehydrogenase family protein [Novispirillum sp. DQ9]|uniref:acyl-CoA dehydrogenase family protein n=1 Tax=Novispirillum sp. DQ9 TaxID=3398612 RepID=UPI003C7B8E86